MSKSLRFIPPPECTHGQKKVFDILNKTKENIFISGAAGTGKTFIIRSIQSQSDAVVVAPTGIAALNCKGSTVHRVFRMPFGILNTRDLDDDQYPNKVLESCRLLIIDEISMVRADLLDGIDHKLKRIKRNPAKPFGGVRVIVIGDFYQLPPVITNSEAKTFSFFYPSPYAFEASSWKEAKFATVLLDEVKRQNESTASILNAIRVGKYEYLDEVNKSPKSNSFLENETTLTTTNFKADNINHQFLDKIDSPVIRSITRTEGKVHLDALPKDVIVKVGARVLLIKNSEYYVNGDVGTVEKIPTKADPIMKVRVERTKDIVPVNVAEWEFRKYRTNQTGEIVSEIEGMAYQYPIKLGWGITIHKSQGMTIPKFTLDVSNSFAHGQLYTGISRIVNLKHLSLTRPITPNDFIIDPVVTEFYNRLNEYDLLSKTSTHNHEKIA
jgi:ATP-dependent DNA helicase PIF1